jgi:3'5'-cyclic nucleotide phosphodiesterase
MFHNFEHASHVTMSVSKLLSRIVAPDIEAETGDLAANLHDHTYGITSDPLTQFAVVISALVHDVDHVGIPNFMLMKENPSLASKYDNKSIAEQNSVEIAWETLMEPQYTDLRMCIYADANGLNRFRQLVANTVLATDIFDKDLSELRKRRWEMAFSTSAQASNTPDDVNRKATIVIEHLIQASDVAHTMQHWHIYQKWNERLYAEMLHAYKLGRWDRDPTPGWYEGELGFFDNYVIPLAKKLKDCGVFGVSSDEYLNYAMENRREWSCKGEDVVRKMALKYGEALPTPKEESSKPESA